MGLFENMYTNLYMLNADLCIRKGNSNEQSAHVCAIGWVYLSIRETLTQMNYLKKISMLIKMVSLLFFFFKYIFFILIKQVLSYWVCN